MDTAGTRGTITAIEDEAATDIAIEARRELLLLQNLLAFLRPTLVFYIYTTDMVMRGNRNSKQRCIVCYSFSLLDIEDLLDLPDLLTAYRTKTRSFSYPCPALEASNAVSTREEETVSRRIIANCT